MTETKVTLATARKLARQKWGKYADVRYNPKALDADEKATEHERRQALRAEHDRVKKEAASMGRTDVPLMEAARFCVDVDAQEPSLSQLRTALERAERRKELVERRDDLYAEIRAIHTYGDRYTAFVTTSMGSLGACNIQKCSADTLEELIRRIESSIV